MTVSQSTRFGLYQWSDDTDPFTRSQMELSHQNIEDRAARVVSGTVAPAPDGQYHNAFFYNTSNNKLFFYAAEDDSGSWTEITGNFIQESIINAKGDIIIGSAADTASTLTVGANNTVLVADSAEAVGAKWTATLSGVTLTNPVITSINNGGPVTVPSGTETLVGRSTTDTLTNKTIALGSNTVSGTLAQFNTAVTDADLVSLAGTETLTNKTLTSPVISTISNSGTITLPTGTRTLVARDTTDTLTNKTLTAPIISTISNTGTLTLPTSTDTLVGRATTDTLSNKTLTAPKFADLGFIADANGNELIIFDTVASAVNEVTLANAALSGTPTLTASGSDTNISINLVPKGSGTIQAGGVDVATTSGTQTLTNKSIALGSNTVTGTLAQFNTAVTDADLVSLAGSETLSNKTLTAPKFADLGFIADANGNEMLIFDTVASAVNELTIANAASGGNPTISATGGGTNISINLVPKGTGTVQQNGTPLATTGKAIAMALVFG